MLTVLAPVPPAGGALSPSAQIPPHKVKLEVLPRSTRDREKVILELRNPGGGSKSLWELILKTVGPIVVSMCELKVFGAPGGVGQISTGFEYGDRRPLSR